MKILVVCFAALILSNAEAQTCVQSYDGRIVCTGAGGGQQSTIVPFGDRAYVIPKGEAGEGYSAPNTPAPAPYVDLTEMENNCAVGGEEVARNYNGKRLCAPNPDRPTPHDTKQHYPALVPGYGPFSGRECRNEQECEEYLRLNEKWRKSNDPKPSDSLACERHVLDKEGKWQVEKCAPLSVRELSNTQSRRCVMNWETGMPTEESMPCNISIAPVNPRP